MKHSVEKIDAIRHRISVEVPAEMVERAYKAAMEKINKEADVPGFRKGKIPEQVLLQRFGQDIEVEAIKEAVRLTYPDAIREAGVHPLSDPEVDPTGKLLHGQPFTYKAIFEVYPEVVLKKYEGLELTSQKISVSQEEIEGELRRLQQQMTQLAPEPEGEIGPGMIAKIDFKGTAGGQAFPGSEAEDYVVDFGAGTLLEEFEVQIKGMKMGEERDIAFHYPTDFFKRDIAGKKAEFRVKLKDLHRKVVPELDDAFAKELGDYGDLAAVRAEIEKRIKAYKEQMVATNLHEQAIRALIADHQDLDVPTALIDSELGNMLEQLRRRLESQGRTFEDAKIDAHQFVRENVKEATDRARGYMLVRAIMEKEGIAVTEPEIEERMQRLAAESRATSEQVKDYFQKENHLEGLRSQMLFEKTLAFVVSKAKVKEEKPKKEK
jgi:trigger factor